jgi:predicted dithiol-disulfide oxidoreductase (DUF899 family)
MDNVPAHPVASRADWLAARKRLLAHEKEFTRTRDRLAEERRALPWVKVDTDYTFETPEGPTSLADLFGSNSQLFVYHFMLGPGDAEGCVGCSFIADHLVGTRMHLEHHDVSVVLVSRAPLDDIRRYQQRMGWDLRWVSSAGTSFNHDYGVGFTPDEVASGEVAYNYGKVKSWGPDAPGVSTFYRNAQGEVFHTYSSYARGGEDLLTTYMVLDMMPLGRNETGADGKMTDWLRRHDAYPDAVKPASSCCG